MGANLEVVMPLSSFPPRSSHSGEGELVSPCVRNCCLDANDICLGCGRSLKEILDWHKVSESERQEILALAKKRLSTRAD